MIAQFRINTKMMRNFVQKKLISCKNAKLLRKRIFCFVETLCPYYEEYKAEKIIR